MMPRIEVSWGAYSEHVIANDFKSSMYIAALSELRLPAISREGQRGQHTRQPTAAAMHTVAVASSAIEASIPNAEGECLQQANRVVGWMDV